MPNPVKSAFLVEMTRRFGVLRKLEKSESLYEVGEGRARLYLRYSKKHPRNRTFFGLRRVDLQALEGHNGIVCFLSDGEEEPLFVPFSDFEEVFAALTPGSDGQYKAQLYEQESGTELYIAKAGRFNVESYLGWSSIAGLVEPEHSTLPLLSHAQVQTLLGGIGAAKGFDIWIPSADRSKLDWDLTPPFGLCRTLPPSLRPVEEVAEGIDVIWVDRASASPAALYEVEHSTWIYSGLLRFNDVHLLFPNLSLRFGIVADDARRSTFVRQVNRPTFAASGLRELCTFLEYRNVYGWHTRMRQGGTGGQATQ
ncbi:MAG: hypothetical protein Q7T82_12810 [Armatimonadota bacterium]|nr:hypothetical protein [Armatimonadota bacterium]